MGLLQDHSFFFRPLPILEAKDLDIIIPTKNAELDLADCLQALSEQTIKVNVIIVDANSTDRTIEIARKYGATIIDEPPSRVKGSKRAVACNEGLRYSSSQIVGFIDSDTIVPHTWAEDLSSYLIKPIGAVTSGCISKEESPLSQSISQILILGSDSHGCSFDEPIEVLSAGGYNALYLREAIDFVSGFSEIIGGCEDWELNYRLRNSGWKILGVPKSPVEHRERRSIMGFAKQMYGYGWSRARLLTKKHIFTPFHLVPSLIFFSLIGLLFWRPTLIPWLIIIETILLSLSVIFNQMQFVVFQVFIVSWALGYGKAFIDLS